MSRPIVTIGVCVRNSASTIHETIKSIMSQDYSHELMEVIFVDDGSQDNTLKIIRSYAPKMDMKVKIFHHKWKGLGYSRKVVVDNACGDYIIWVDGDMILPSDFVSKQVKFMETHREVCIGKGRYTLYNTDSLVAYLENLSAIVGLKNLRKNAYVPLGTGGSIYRVKAIKKVGGFNEALKGVGEDMDIELRVIKAGWKLSLTSAFFYERRRERWYDLWREYFWHGYGGSKIINRIKESRRVVCKFFLPVAILTIISQAIMAYKMTHKKAVFLLPFHWIFKRIAWLTGFLMGHI